jgi:cytochrome c biogenesis protein CcdA
MLCIGIIAGVYSCALLEVPFLASVVSITSKGKKQAFKKSVAFVLGLITSYVIIGFFFGQVAKLFVRYGKLTFGLFIFVGVLACLWGLKIIFTGNTCSCSSSCLCSDDKHNHVHQHQHSHSFIDKFSFFKKAKNFWQIYLVGNLFAWIETPVCPCCGPVIYILSSLTIMKGKIVLGLSTFAIYSLGQGIPVIIFCVFLAHIVNHPKMLKSKRYFNILMGNIMLFIGLLFLWIA